MKVVLANPRGFCAGVVSAIELVEYALDTFGAPIYVRHAIVHNQRVIESLSAKGAVFIDNLDDVPYDSLVIFSAHGVSPQIWEEARKRNLKILDATCPLVLKVHNEVKHLTQEGYKVILIGHKDHVEVIGSRGEAPHNVIVVGSIQDVEMLRVPLDIPDPEKVAWLSQTTLSVDDTKNIVSLLCKRFPAIIGPAKDDICYATQNRQDAVKRMLAAYPGISTIYVIGSQESSNTKRLVEVAQARGVNARRIDNFLDLIAVDFEDEMTIGLTSGASAPEELIQEILDFLKITHPLEVEELSGVEELTRFPLTRYLKNNPIA
jgi:4-hydroxy-3-methylbut-2-en-1-yl diphosphate reductase